MNTLWPWMTILAALGALLTGNAGEASSALLGAGAEAVELTVTLLGTMTLWSGLMEILTETGDLQRMSRALRRLLTPLFPGVQAEACWEPMSLNLAANVLGLGNAATPAGIRAAKALAAQGEAGRKALAMLLTLNNSSLQALPTTVIALRAAAGAANPADIWPVCLASSGAATLTAALLMSWVNRRKKPYE